MRKSPQVKNSSKGGRSFREEETYGEVVNKFVSKLNKSQKGAFSDDSVIIPKKWKTIVKKKTSDDVEKELPKPSTSTCNPTMITKNGSSGRPITITTNHKRIKLPLGFSFYHNKVTFDPPLADDDQKRDLLDSLRSELGENYYFNGHSVFTLNRQLEGMHLIERDGGQRVAITFNKKNNNGDTAEILTKIITSRVAEHLNFHYLSECFYDSSMTVSFVYLFDSAHGV